MATVTHNIIANFAGRAWAMLMSVAFVPLYLKFLGVEGYGLIGFFTALQGIIVVADLGLSWIITRELARGAAGSGDDNGIATVIRTTEAIYWVISISVGALIALAAHWIAHSWITPVELSPATIENAVWLMGITIALQTPAAFYQAGLNGLQRQPLVNVILVISSTFRWLGAVLVLWLIASTIEAFFVWQAIVGGATALTSAAVLWRLVPGRRPATFDPGVVKRLMPFALTVSVSGVAWMLSTQLDKLVLSKLISLQQFGYYSLAVLVASILSALLLPVTTALYPRFAQIMEQGQDAALASLYHTGCQLVSLIMLPATLVIAFFSYDILLIWTGSESTASNAALFTSLLIVGNMIFSLAGMANHLLYAANRPGVSMRGYFLMAAFVVPGLFLTVPQFGAIAAALLWIAASCLYVVFVVTVMHRKLLRAHLGRWFLFDTLIPALAALSVVFCGHALISMDHPLLANIAILILIWAAATSFTLLFLPDVKRALKVFALQILQFR